LPLLNKLYARDFDDYLNLGCNGKAIFALLEILQDALV
jgi:hypothetical protein